MTHCADPLNTPEMRMLREHIRDWRFYDQLRNRVKPGPVFRLQAKGDFLITGFIPLHAFGAWACEVQ